MAAIADLFHQATSVEDCGKALRAFYIPLPSVWSIKLRYGERTNAQRVNSMNLKVTKSMADQDARAAQAAVEAARGFVGRIAELAPRMRANRKLDDALIEDMDKAGLFSLLVPKRWGGAGLGPQVANRVTEIIGSADCSTGWVTGFYILHNWLICRFPLEVQEALYKDRKSVNVPALFGPPGKAEPVEGGYRVSGRWPYASGAWHGSHALVPAMVGEAMHWFIMPREDVECIDDWHMEAMSATGSITIAATDIFVADGWHWDINRLTSVDAAPGAGLHDDLPYKLPFTALLMVPLSPCLGALDRAVELGRERLEKSRPLGFPRIKRATARSLGRSLREGAGDATGARRRHGRGGGRRPCRGEPLSRKRGACATAPRFFRPRRPGRLRQLMDGLGSSTYRTDDPLFRMTQDVSVLVTHAHGPDFDVVMDRHARGILGLGPEPGDPKTRLMEQMIMSDKQKERSPGAPKSR